MRPTRNRPGRGWCRVRLVAVAVLAAWTAGGVRADEKTPELPPEILTKVTEALKKAAVQKRKQFDVVMRGEIDATVKDLGLDPEGAKGLEAVAAKAEDAAQDSFEAGCLQEFREAYVQNGAGSLEWVVNPGMPEFIAGPTGPTGSGVRFTGPLDQPAWKDGVAKILSPAQLAVWEKARTERKQLVDKAIAAFLDQQIERQRVPLETPLLAQSLAINTTLDLPKERSDQITALAKKAVDASLEAWRHAAAESLSRDEAQRNQALKSKNFYFQSHDKDAPEKQAVWTDGLAKLLTDAERARLQAARDSHKARRVHALGQLLVAMMDEKVAFTENQRGRLEPTMERSVQSKAELFAESNGNYYSVQPESLYKAATAAKPEEVDLLLDDLQRKRWQAIGRAGNVSSNNEDEFPQPTPLPQSVQEASAGEPEDMERLVSDYVQARAADHYKQVESGMILQAEDAARVASLEAPHAARLQTAARGTAEAMLAAWVPSVEQNTRAEVQGATPENIRQKLVGGMNYYYERSDSQSSPLWKAAVNAELTPLQQVAWTTERDARSRYNAAALAGYLLAEFDRKVSLSPEQWDQLAPLLTKAVQDYQPDIRTMFSYSNSPWFLMSYSMFLPLHAIPENDLKAILSHEQWDQWSGSNEFGNSASYWENVRRNHEQRAKQKQS